MLDGVEWIFLFFRGNYVVFCFDFTEQQMLELALRKSDHSVSAGQCICSSLMLVMPLLAAEV